MESCEWGEVSGGVLREGGLGGWGAERHGLKRWLRKERFFGQSRRNGTGLRMKSQCALGLFPVDGSTNLIRAAQ